MKRRLFSALACITLLCSLAEAQTNVRGWHENGQTWIVWQETGVRPFTYDIYRSSEPIVSLENAELIGRLFYEDWSGVRLYLADHDYAWTIPDGQGGLMKLDSDEGVFAYTPHQAVPEYFAVVKHDETAVGPDNSVGPVDQTLDPIQCYPQTTGTTYFGGDFTAYAFWIDGRDDWESGRADFPVMGNAAGNGTGVVFALAEPIAGRPVMGKIPAVLVMHGTGNQSSFWDFISNFCTLVFFDMTLENGFLVSLDDCVYIRKTNFLGHETTGPQNTQWFGYWPGYNRFELPTEFPPEDTVLIDYTVRKSLFVMDWVIAHQDADPDRFSILGYSGGGAGANYLARRYPERFSVVHNFVPEYKNWTNPYSLFLLGLPLQNLATNYPGNPGITDLHWPTIQLSDREPPLTRYLHGTLDAVEFWLYKVMAFNEMNDLRWGCQIFWDERAHADHYVGAHWNPAPFLMPPEMIRHRRDQSYPAFSNDDHDIEIQGRQPDPNEDDWGTWGGYFSWDLDSITDTADTWAVTLSLFSQSTFAPQNAPFDSAVTDLSIRRAQRFHPTPDTFLYWLLYDTQTDAEIASGNITVPDDGLVTVESIPVTKAPARLIISTEEPVMDDDDDDDDNNDDDNDDGSDDDDDDDDEGEDDDLDGAGSDRDGDGNENGCCG